MGCVHCSVSYQVKLTEMGRIGDAAVEGEGQAYSVTSHIALWRFVKGCGRIGDRALVAIHKLNAEFNTQQS